MAGSARKHTRAKSSNCFPQKVNAPGSVPWNSPGNALENASGNFPDTIMNEAYTPPPGNAAAESDAISPVISGQDFILLLWGIGAGLYFAYHIIRYFTFKRRITPHCSAANTELLDSILQDLKIKTKPQLLTCPKIAGPMMIGFLKPTILLPDTTYSNDELQVVLRHELTHFKRLDLWYKLLLLIANSIHFFNPLVYLMVKQANRDLEYSCDDAVVKNHNLDFRKAYSLTLLKSMGQAETTSLSTYLNETTKDAKRRFANILDTKTRKKGFIAFALVFLLVGLTGSLVACSNNPNLAGNNLAGFSVNFSGGTLPDAQELYKYKNTLLGDNSKVVSVIDLLPVDGLTRDKVELNTSGPDPITLTDPAALTINYTTPDRAFIRPQLQEYMAIFSKNAAVLLSLIPNAEDILIRINDDYGEVYLGYYYRENISDHLRTDQITVQMISEATDSLESFASFIQLVNGISVEITPDSERDKILREIIGADKEIVTNSGYTLPFIFRESIVIDGFDLRVCARDNGVDIENYLGKQIDCSLYQVENYRTKESSTYVFAFSNDELIAYKDLITPENEELVRYTLIQLAEHFSNEENVFREVNKMTVGDMQLRIFDISFTAQPFQYDPEHKEAIIYINFLNLNGISKEFLPQGYLTAIVGTTGNEYTLRPDESIENAYLSTRNVAKLEAEEDNAVYYPGLFNMAISCEVDVDEENFTKLIYQDENGNKAELPIEGIKPVITYPDPNAR